VQVDLEYLAELRGGLLVEHAGGPDRRVGHADVQPPPALHGGRDHRLPAGRIGRVGIVGHRLPARGRDLGDHAVGRPAAVRVRHPVAVADHHLRALPGQGQAERPPEPAPAAGDHRHPPGQRPVPHGRLLAGLARTGRVHRLPEAGLLARLDNLHRPHRPSAAQPMDGRCRSVYCSVVSETEPWSYHADGSPVYSLADIIAEAVRRDSRGDRADRGGPADLVRPARPAIQSGRPAPSASTATP